MDEDTTGTNRRESNQTSGHQPPIQWPAKQNTPLSDNERAAQLARQHVDRAYTHQEHTQTQTGPQKQHPHTMRNEEYDWQQYHNAWQQYYHQYFYRYYAGWWQQQKTQLEESTQKQLQEAEDAGGTSKQAEVTKELRTKVRTSINKRTKKVKESSHFKPLLAAFGVGAAFLLINYNQVLVGAVKQYVAPGSVVTTPVIVEPSAADTVGSEPRIVIPKIGVDSPVVYDEPKVDEASYQAALERGVVRLGNSADPGTKGNVVIGGHSSNNVFNSGKYKYVFVNLKRLDVGDIFYLNFNGKRYTYKVFVAKKVITPKETSVLAQTEKPTVTLFTCDPPGTNVNRLIVQAEQIDPNPAAASPNANQQTKANSTNPLPSVAPSLWDRIFSWL